MHNDSSKTPHCFSATIKWCTAKLKKKKRIAEKRHATY